MLIVLITRWQVVSFWSNLYVIMSRNKSQGIVVSFFHAIYATWLDQMPSKKRGRVRFCLQRQGGKSRKNCFAGNGLLLWPVAMAEGVERATRRWMWPSVSTSTFSASRSKIMVEEPLADLKSKNTETWQKFHGHAIVAGERLQEKINKSVTCCFCQVSIELLENSQSKNGLGSNWMLQCQNKSCPLHETNLVTASLQRRLN